MTKLLLIKLIMPLLTVGLSSGLYGQELEIISNSTNANKGMVLKTLHKGKIIEAMFWDSEGNVGVGTTEPLYKLHVKGTMQIDTALEVSAALPTPSGYNIAGPRTAIVSNPDYGWIGTTTNHHLSVGVNGRGLIILKDRKVGINVGDPLGHLDVTGTPVEDTRVIIRDYDEDLSITDDLVSKFNLFTTNGIWSEDFAISDKSVLQPDYVFEESYALSSLDFLEDFVKTNKHLPDVPGVSQIEKDGYLSLSEQSTGILKNLEEQVLHNIAQEKKIKAQARRLQQQEAQLKMQQQKLERLEELVNQLVLEK